MLGIGLCPAAAAQVPAASSLPVALCLNDWNRAIVLIGPLIAAETITPARRQALVEYRQRLVSMRDQRVRAVNLPGCETVLSRYLALQPDSPSSPLDWEGAIAQGDLVTIEVDVTEVYSGSLYTDDDSQLFLFDSQGTLLVENDDFTGLQSTISDFELPFTDRYYVAVTTYNNDPVLDGDRRITDWSGNGGSDIDFTIVVTGLTPVDQLALPE
ncbi:hypothetical protein C7271_15525 [filamentous cyanobacterium CCP5]|nr:hypothetical protein C7271_15525 [filamentous cyanobacterium CCP5]